MIVRSASSHWRRLAALGLVALVGACSGSGESAEATPAGAREDRGSWPTGVAAADVNGDGLVEIYMCRAGPGTREERANQLWINQGRNKDGVPTFKEMAKKSGVAAEGFSTQAVFFDYDHDDDLD